MLAPYTTLQVGGPAQYFVSVDDVASLPSICEWAAQQPVPISILAGGSNVVVADDGVPGLVLHIRLRGRQVRHEGSEVLVTYAAGEVFDEAVADTVREGWWGLENLSHIPGTVGATPVQNVGAYGVEVADCIESVTVFDMTTHETSEFSPTDCRFGYRTSYFKTTAGRRYLITAVTFRLSSKPTPQLTYADLQPLRVAGSPTQAAIRETVIAIRAGKFPDWRTVGTAGSFFKNPIITAAQCAALQQQYPDVPTYTLADGRCKVALGWILDHVCGYKGYREGPVGTHTTQALVVVNYGDATAAQIADFATGVREAVAEQTGLEIEWEVTPMPAQW